MERIENISIAVIGLGYVGFATRQIVFDQISDRGFRLESGKGRCFDVRS